MVLVDVVATNASAPIDNRVGAGVPSYLRGTVVAASLSRFCPLAKTRLWHKADNQASALRLSAIGPKADKAEFWLWAVCLLFDPKRTWPPSDAVP